MESFHGDLLTRTLNFHGQQLQKIWEAERGEADLMRHTIKDLDFLEYAQRQKHLSFQDRGKRLKLHQFITKKSNMLFAQNALENIPQCETLATEDIYAIMPPFETFLSVDKQNRLRYFFENVKIGDLILGTIVSKTTSGMMLKVLCTVNKGSTVRYVADINVKAFCPVGNVIAAVDRKGVSRSYMMNDSVCCEVLEVIPDTDKMVCGMKGSTRQPGDPDPRPALGLITAEDFPLEYKKALDNKGENYDTVLEKSVGFNNPNNISYLTKQMAIATDHCSLMTGLKGRFPEQEYAIELRQVQASKWAFRSVADGIDHFKAGRHTEAFQCLNKALTIDPKNVEGLVARGALYANSGNFQKAIEDFETALKLNPSHANARKYMGETLVALGRSYEDENKLEEARKAYQSCLTIIPFHEEAQNSLDFLKNKANATKNLIEPAELMLPTISANKPFDVKDNLMKQLMKTDDQGKKEKKKKKKSKKRKNRHHSSSSSSSSSSGSSHSSSSSSSSTTDSSSGSSDSEFKKRKKRHHRREKQRSLSPLSKRMAMMDPSHETPSNYQFNKPNASFQFGFEQPVEAPAVAALKNPEDTEYETKVRNFLEQTKGDSDYEDKVRKFLEETARWKKDKKSYDKKKKKKRDKKAKKESKKKRKDKKLRHKDFDLHELEEQIESKKLRDALKKEFGVKDKHKRRNMNMDVADYFLEKAGLLDNIPDLEDIESKLRDYYAMEKESKRSERSMSISPKRIIIDSPSPTREQKARQAVAEASASASSGTSNKWKMQIGAVQGGSRFKKRTEREDWGEERRMDEELKKPPLPPPEEKGISVRKAMALKEPLPKKEQPPEPPKFKPKPTMNQKPMITPGQVVLDKFGSFRLLSPTNSKKIHDDDLPPLPPGAPPKSAYPNRASKPPEPPGRPRSGSRSPKRKSRSRSRGKYSRPSSRSSSASRSRGGRSRSRSYRSRSRSYYSRSRSRSGSRSYYSRSRSRSRSYSGDRRRVHDRRGGFRGRYNDRGTYYKPRFQNYKNQRGGYNRGRGNYNRDGRDFNRDYRDYRGGRGGNRFNYNNRGRRPRGRFRGNNYRDFRDRRYDRSRSRDNSRDRSVSRENDESTMKKVNEEKEKINKYLDNGDEPVRHEGPLSEGEDRDDYSSDKFVDRQSFDGKWAEKDKKEEAADKESAGGGGGLGSGGGETKIATKPNSPELLPPETNIAEMDKFLTRAKKEKKEEMLERNKDMLKTKPW